MKKIFFTTIIIFLLVMIPGYSYADSYTFNDGRISIDPGQGVTAYTGNSDVSGIEDAPEDFSLLVKSDDLGYYWYFYFMKGNNTLDFSSMDDEKILELIENDSTDIETDDVSSEVYDNGNKYLVIDSYSKDTDQYIHYYVTGVGNALYYFIAPSKTETLTDAQKADFRKAIDNVEYVKQEAPTELEQRQAALIRTIKRFGIAFGALAVFVVIKLAVEKIRDRSKKS